MSHASPDLARQSLQIESRSHGRRRWITWAFVPVVLLIVGVIARVLAVRYYRLEWLGPVGIVCFGLSVLAFHALGLLLALRTFRSRVVRIACVAGCGLTLLVVAYFAVVGMAVALLSGRRTVTTVVQSPDGRYELVVESYWVIIDPAFDVWLREREGIFARKVLVWTSRESTAPKRVTFVERYQIEVMDERGDTRRSRFDPDTLRPSEVHCLGIWCPDRPLRDR
jgi:hypothetical protein